jgi:AcrR family transcriptional regulator
LPSSPDVSEERRAQIIEAALACFSRRGYNNTTMDDIAAESGLSKGSLYWYFESKDDLFESAIRSFFDDSLGREALAALGGCRTASDKLRTLAEGMVRFCRWAEGLFNLFVEFWVSSSRREEASEVWLDVLLEYKDVVVGIIEEGIQSGEFKPVDAEQLVWAMMAAYDGLAVYLTLNPDLDLEQVSESFIEALLSGLMVDGQAPGDQR